MHVSGLGGKPPRFSFGLSRWLSRLACCSHVGCWSCCVCNNVYGGGDRLPGSEHYCSCMSGIFPSATSSSRYFCAVQHFIECFRTLLSLHPWRIIKQDTKSVAAQEQVAS